jgi:DNA-binding IclR family transcriptional regulator
LVQSVERAAAMLRLLADESDGLELHEIADSLGLAKGTAHGLLRTLHEVGFVEQERQGGNYRLVPDVLRLGSERWDLNELRSRAINWCDALAARTGESVRLAAFRDNEVVVVHHVFRADASKQSLTTGATLSLHASAPGKVLVAFEPNAARAWYSRDLLRLTPYTITDRRVLQRELASVRDLGYATSVEEVTIGVSAIAAPIRDRGGYVVAAVSVQGPPQRLFDDKRKPRPTMVNHVARAGRSISRELGHGRAW